MANYKVVLRRDESTIGEKALDWEIGCPLFIEAYQVSREIETGAAYLQIRVRNICSKAVAAFEVSGTVSFRTTSSQSLEEKILDADINPGKSFDLTPIALEDGDVVDIEALKIVNARIVPEEVWDSRDVAIKLPENPQAEFEPSLAKRYAELILDDQTEWAHEQNCNLVLYTASGKVPEASEIATKALVDNDSWWRCPCGAINLERETCHSCHAKKSTLMISIDPDRQDRIVDTLKEEEISRKNNAYDIAVTLMEQGNLTSLKKAVSEFEKLGDWKDSAERLSECNARFPGLKKKFVKRIVITAIAAVVAIAAIAVAASVVPRISQHSNLKETGVYDAKVGDVITLGQYEQDNDLSNGKEDIEWIVLEADGDEVYLLSKYVLDCREFDSSNVWSPYGDWESSDLKDWLESDFRDEAGLDRIDCEITCLSYQEYIDSSYASNWAYGLTQYADSQSGWSLGWWLRDTGVASYESKSDSGETKGKYEIYTVDTDSDNGVRPAMRIEL